MRPSNYLEEIASITGVEAKTLVVIDRGLAEKGLRRKGRGRVIPFPTLRETLRLIIAINLLHDVSPVRMAAAVAAWEGMTCQGSNGGLPKDEGKQLLQFMEETSELILQGKISCELVWFEFDKTLAQCTFRYGETELFFQQPANPPVRIPADTVSHCRKISLIDGHLLFLLARADLDGEFDLTGPEHEMMPPE